MGSGCWGREDTCEVGERLPKVDVRECVTREIGSLMAGVRWLVRPELRTHRWWTWEPKA